MKKILSLTTQQSSNQRGQNLGEDIRIAKEICDRLYGEQTAVMANDWLRHAQDLQVKSGLSSLQEVLTHVKHLLIISKHF